MSIKTKKFNESYSFAEQPTRDDLELWADQGFRSVVNLRPAEEVERGLSPSEEASLCKESGLEYLHLPTSLDGLDQAFLQSAKERLKSVKEPVVVHCAGGARAAILVAAVHALCSGASSEEVLARVEETGQSFNAELRARTVGLIDSAT